MKKIFLLCLLVVVAKQHATAQEKMSVTEKTIETIVESILENLDEETDASLIVEDLESYAERPLNINTATAEELGKLHLLDDIQINKLLEYRNQYGADLFDL
jgi:DNA uptake protein ComE-like DNA-binding protein